MDSSAFDIIYENNAGAVYQTALRYSGNHHTAEEITQTVFMKLYMNMEGVNERAVNAWLLTAAKHMAMNYTRGLRREVLKAELLYCEDNARVPVVRSPEDEMIENLYREEDKELTEDIFANLYRVNPKWYFAVTVTYFLERPQKETAETLGISQEALHSMLYRAKKWIRKKYQKQFDHLHEE